MKVACTNGCFEREVPEDMKAIVKHDEHFLTCFYCGNKAIISEED